MVHLNTPPRPPREFYAEELQAEPQRVTRSRGCTIALLSGFLTTTLIGMCIPRVALAVLGIH